MKLPNKLELEAELAARDFHFFFRRFAWPVLLPGVTFNDSWHIHAICEHLAACESRQIKKLIINLPFRLLKSTLISQAFPAWVWVRNSSQQLLTASYARDLAIRDAVNSRRIIESEEYRRAWGHLFSISTDQNVKSRVDNTRGGTRVITSTDGQGTGFGGNVRIVDDPISAGDANSALAIQTSIEWWRGTMATRGNDPETDVAIVVQQRLNEQDLSGFLLKEEKGWEHLVLPMRYEKAYTKTTQLGFKDPRTQEGQLLHPERLGEEKVKELEQSLGSFHTAAQLQQRPARRGGVIIHGEWFKRYKILPKIEYRRIYADTAQKTKERNDFSVFECWGYAEGHIYLLDLIRGKWEAPELKKRAIAFWAKHKAEDPLFVGALRQMKIEDKSSGTGLIQDIQNTGGIPVEAIQRSVDKYTRVLDGLAYVEAGLVHLPEEAPWVNDFITENESFSANDSHDHDDQIDPEFDAIKDMLGGPDIMSVWAKLSK